MTELGTTIGVHVVGYTAERFKDDKGVRGQIAQSLEGLREDFDALIAQRGVEIYGAVKGHAESTNFQGPLLVQWGPTPYETVTIDFATDLLTFTGAPRSVNSLENGRFWAQYHDKVLRRLEDLELASRVRQ